MRGAATAVGAGAVGIAGGGERSDRANGEHHNQLIFCTRAIGLPPSAQLLGFYFFSTLEIIVRLHEKKPSTLAIADRTCLLQVLFRLVPQDIDAHAAIPRYLGRHI
jgi:hypothetical protein